MKFLFLSIISKNSSYFHVSPCKNISLVWFLLLTPLKSEQKREAGIEQALSS